MYGRPPSSIEQQSRWPDLPLDLLREISTHLRHVTDFVRFHAVCKAWHSSNHSATSRRAQSFLPWLLAPSTSKDNYLNLRCVFSKTSYVAQQPSSDTWRDWVGGADGSVRYFTALPYPMLHDPLVAGGVPTVLQASFPKPKGWWPDSASGILYSDGTILLFKSYFPIGHTSEFKAAILRPGDATWMVVERTFESPDYPEISVAYHAGKILVTLDAFLWHVLKPETVAKQDDNGDILVPNPLMLDEHDEFWNEYSYILESDGELLWVLVNVKKEYPVWCHMVRALSVSVHALQKDPTSEKMWWVRNSGRSLADRVFFLGSPNSFAVDASQLDSDGGCAYFVCDNYYESFQYQRICVFRYNLVNDEAEITEWLPQTWRSETVTWLVFQPTIAPIQEICKRLLEAPNWKRMQQAAPVTPRSLIDRIVMPLQPCFKILVCNPPLTVNISQLRHFFGKHGEVFNAEIIYDKKTGMPKCKGLVTMVMVRASQEDALAALNGLDWNGCILEISLVSKAGGQRRWPPSSGQAAQLHIA